MNNEINTNEQVNQPVEPQVPVQPVEQVAPVSPEVQVTQIQTEVQQKKGSNNVLLIIILLIILLAGAGCAYYFLIVKQQANTPVGGTTTTTTKAITMTKEDYLNKIKALNGKTIDDSVEFIRTENINCTTESDNLTVESGNHTIGYSCIYDDAEDEYYTEIKKIDNNYTIDLISNYNLYYINGNLIMIRFEVGIENQHITIIDKNNNKVYDKETVYHHSEDYVNGENRTFDAIIEKGYLYVVENTIPEKDTNTTCAIKKYNLNTFDSNGETLGTFECSLY